MAVVSDIKFWSKLKKLDNEHPNLVKIMAVVYISSKKLLVGLYSRILQRESLCLVSL